MPTHSITLRGDVLDVGLREVIAELGEKEGRRGLVFNEADGSVRILLGGTRDRVNEFVEEIRARSAQLWATIDSVEVEEVNAEIPLPPFVNPPTDDLADINRKVGNGVRSLADIQESTDRLPTIETNTERLIDGQELLVENTDKLVDGQERMIELLDERL